MTERSPELWFFLKMAKYQSLASSLSKCNWKLAFFSGRLLNILCRGKSKKQFKIIRNQRQTTTEQSWYYCSCVFSTLKSNIVREVKHYQLRRVFGKMLDEKEIHKLVILTQGHFYISILYENKKIFKMQKSQRGQLIFSKPEIHHCIYIY